ncbi:acyl-CoA dehydrogenase family protein [Salinibacterium sp. NSLL150]|uniref:acyl-CoA dehydrogenase family protein n=1 Tax=unclassified Salinibacterium TaxID=2632331 RepID=UPI0018CF96B8|nr:MULTISPECIES: acyl-CoA dehydrogenase family protein [unclassified Salinibacterium]MBH0098774.1 acyl-CoA dehydrogenase family protein [Salinibacterium sp. NSLL35]MBH0101529.1 acyl-CoA dehydrogenase family protein [Salinibacterium sp. NSLL150]MBH0104288.1 acyl-CoA dehydrogenase family protein [Salinibacterium sp. NSLL16]MBH0107049.1 acyl-CoA dehydrogenase family protein [Salinibacterium sp. NSLL17]
MSHDVTRGEITHLGLTDEQLKLSADVRDFADKVVAPAAYEYDTKRELPYGIIAQMGEMGLFGLPFPKEFGGQGKDYVSLCLAIEQLARVDQSIAVTLEAGIGLGAMPIFKHGSEEQKQQWVPMLARGEALAGFGLTEADAGSDAAGTKTTAELVDGEWVINGTKQFITNSGSEITKVVTVTAVTGRRENGRPELSAILVPNGTPGFTVHPPYDKVGWHTSDTHPLSFDNVRVPEENLMGERGRGFANFIEALDEGRVAFSALCTGAAQGCLEESIRYANERHVFGRSIGSNQHIAFKIARMQARVHSARLATYDAARKLVAGVPFKMEASLAKMISSEAAMDNARDATQIFGGYGFMNENPVARHYRDSKVLELGEGTTEVQMMVIARELGFATL